MRKLTWVKHMSVFNREEQYVIKQQGVLCLCLDGNGHECICAGIIVAQ
jgi:hypothetical protein